MKRSVVLVSVLLLGVALVGFAGFGAALKGKVAVVLDVGGRGDLSFNDMGFKGTDDAALDFNLEMTEVQCATAADYLPNLRNLARSGEYDLILCVGFLFADALGAAADEFPDQKFAVIDVGWLANPNVMQFVFRENEMSALVGALAGMVATHFGHRYVGCVLGIEIPVLYHFEAGYRFGIDWGVKRYNECGLTAGADVGLLYTYTGSFSDIALGKAATEAQLGQGAAAVYNVAGPLGIGDLEAITEWHANEGTTIGPPYYIGVDANQDYLGSGMHGIASGMKRVDVAAYTAVKSVVEGTFKSGVTSLGLAEGGVGISKLGDLIDFIEFGVDGKAVDPCDFYTIVENWAANRANIPCCIWDAIDELEAGILDGSIVVPTADTVDEMQAVRDDYPLP